MCSTDGGGPFCGYSLDFCDSTNHCAAKTLAYYGQPCLSGDPRDPVIECRGFGQCDFQDNVCVPPAGDGDFCDTSQALPCLPPAVCVDHVCRFPEPGMCTPSLWH